jgi:hypothetical protein
MRKMKKFSAGGNAKYDAKYKRKIEDIKSDYDKAMKGKTGRAAEVAKAKYEQRMADAKDDLAKWTKADRTETRAAEKSAERNLTMTRKFGAMKSAVKADDVAKVPEAKAATETKPAAPEKKAEPKSFGEAFRAARASMGAGKTFTWQGKSYSTNRAGEGKPAAGGKGKPPTTGGGKPQDTGSKGKSQDIGSKGKSQDTSGGKPQDTSGGKPQATGTPPVAKQKTPMTRSEMARKRFGELIGYGGTAASDAKTQANTARMREQQAQRARWSDVETQGAKAAKLARLKAAANAPGASTLAKQRYQSAVSSGSYAGGGTVKKKSTPPKPTPPQPTPAERARSKRQDESFKKIKPTDLSQRDKDTLGGMKKGGKVHKYAAGGLAKVMPTADQMGSLGMKKGGKVKNGMADKMGRAMMKKAGGGKCYAKGGSVSARADGCAVKGKTKGKMI